MTATSEPPLKVAIVPVTPFEQNCAIVWDTATKVGAIVDPGGDADRILDAVKQIGVTIEKILLTHGHLDHAGGVADVVAALNVPVEGPHAGDRMLMANIAEQGRMYGIQGLRNATSDRWLTEGDRVSVSGLSFDVLHVPGHSPGSVVFVSREAPMAFVGDTLFQGSIGRTDLPGGNAELLLSGIREKLFALPDETLCLSGHGPATSIGRERTSNPFLT
jgi:hydroxyacylglutathione hydrolase